ncbi:WD40 repeat-like protein [Curvularia clavata]|uniref:WD40 repeat-like protein n=1 Tax=Curvularia clavata TaxID=95742 RepID=A0A9Q8Z6F8_CURCL|nr:WD40 repeat-like protein [Curvularia clavata]
MRLLKYGDNDEFSIAEFGEDTKPPYAILSHRWGPEADEVTFEDVVGNKGKDKPGYAKIRFCGEQAQRDGLQYFWIDTCCINKANKAELSLAIQLMFRWYRNSVRCYAYLSDVSVSHSGEDGGSNVPAWEPDFRKSEWFVRGWTLQELLAPSSVEFFSQQWEKLGDKKSLLHQIHEITGIPHSALQGARLSQFSINERLRWTEYRYTTYPEDKVYSLLGIVDVDLAPCYGEGLAGAFRRLHDEIDKTKRCIQDLRDTDPRDDKKRIEDTKGGLLKDSYRWVLHNDSFRQWREDQQRLLWIKSDPGKGKTMLLCGIIDELQDSMPQGAVLSYFFCQATDARINSATAVLRGLLYMVVSQQPSLALNVRKRYDQAGKKMFEDANAWVVLAKMFTDVLRDPSLTTHTTYLIIDALDECITNLPELLDFVAKQSSALSHVKWIVSSRNWPEIEGRLEQIVGHKVRLSLELNAASVSTAVQIFIDQRVSELAHQNKYDDTTKRAVLEHLASNANDTFLWVALVCQHLRATARRNVLRKLELFPLGLNALYERMMQQINKTDDAELCKQVLATVALVYRPITLEELVALVEPLEDITDDSELQEIIGYCGSFLTLRGRTIYFVHQSAKDFLLTKAAQEVFPAGQEAFHYSIFARSLQVMSTTLQRDIYGLKVLGISIDDVKIPEPDPLVAVRYSCVHWVDHLRDSNPTASATYAGCLQDGGLVERFLKEKFLYWLESLSLCESMPKGVVSMNEVQMLVQAQGKSTSSTELVYDAYRFVMYHKQVIEIQPLQVYGSGLLFSPTQSLVRKLFRQEKPEGITIKPGIRDGWSACLQTLEGHMGIVCSVAFSHDSTLLASGSRDDTVKIWDVRSGTCLQTLEYGNMVDLLAFSHDSRRLASSDRRDVKIWDVSNGMCLQTLELNDGYLASAAFSHDATRLASFHKGTVKVLDTSNGACLQTFENNYGDAGLVAFSHDSAWLALASATNHGAIHIWDIRNAVCLQKLRVPTDSVTSIVFSRDSARLASVSRERTIRIWDTGSGVCLQTFEGYTNGIASIVFSNDSGRLFSGYWDGTIKIWDVRNGDCLQALESHSTWITSVVLSPDSTQLVSGSGDKTIKIWDTNSSTCLQTSQDHSYSVILVVLSHVSTRLASASYDETIKIWDTRSGECLQTLKGHSDTVSSVDFSHDYTWLASASNDKTIKIWDTRSGECLQTLKGHQNGVESVAFLHDSKRLASASNDKTIKIWDTRSGECLQTLEGHSDTVSSVDFSHDSTWLVSTSKDRTIKIWDMDDGACLQTLQGHRYSVVSAAFSHDSTRLASSSWDGTVKIWNASSGACLLTLDVGRRLYCLSFDATGEYLITDIGSIDVSTSMGSATVNATELQHPRYVGVGISIDGTWITYDGKELIWIPPEYRPTCSFVHGDTIGIGTTLGRTWSFFLYLMLHFLDPYLIEMNVDA